MTSESPQAPTILKSSLSAPQVQKIQGQGLGNIPTHDPGQQPAGTPEAQSTPPGHVTLDWNGVQRTLPVEEVVRLAMEGEKAASTMAAAQQLVAKDAVLRDIGSHLERYDPATRELVVRAVRDPSLLRPKVPPPAPVERDPFGEPAPARQAGDDRIDRIEQAVVLMGQALGSIGAKEQQQTYTQRIDQLMQELPALRDGPPAMREFAREHVLTLLQTNPDADIRNAVSKAARVAHAFTGGGSVAPSPFIPTNAGAPTTPTTASDLATGSALMRAKQYAEKAGLRI